MTAQEFLEQYQDALRAERRLGRLIQRQRDRLMIYGIDTSRVKGQVSHLSDQQAKLVAELVDFIHELEAKKAESLAVMQEVAGVIDRLEDPRYRSLLWLRYIDGASWRDVARKTGYAYSYAFRLHMLALHEVKLLRPDLS